MTAPDQTNAEVSDERLQEIIAARYVDGDPTELKAIATELLTRRSVTSQASEGAVAWPEWATDKHIAEGILAEAETIVQLIIHGHEEQIAEHTGAIKSYAGTLLSRENHRHKYASPSKRVERLETACLADRLLSLTTMLAGVEFFYKRAGALAENLAAVKNIRTTVVEVAQALQGDRS
jgi:hypothetical protein